ncbi:MAG: T9SS type A sorting domain-containing protein, partial [Bacteroidales bacterium]|nr:T9SS type A sorting domain-containing protein [Bacteroidales bacterium]
MINKYTIILLYLLFSFSGQTQNRQIVYSFFVAGHTYGQPGAKNGLHPPFKKKFDYIRKRREIKFGVFTGDIVAANPTADDWDKVDADIENLGLPVYFTVGNHDMENRELFENRYGNTYYSFSFENDLFIVLDPNLDGWNISGEQLVFLKNTLNDNNSITNNIFVLFHQLLWWENNNAYAKIGPNSFEGRADSINFWNVIEPMFSKLPNEVFMFAGDVGAGSWAVDFMYDKYSNISLIASGMGENNGDNFIVVNVYEDNSVGYDLICLNDSVLNCFGNLTDYRLTTIASSLLARPVEIFIYPNPANHQFKVLIKSTKEKFMNFHLFDIHGKRTISKQIQTNTVSEIQQITGGLYFFLIENNGVKLKSGSIL